MKFSRRSSLAVPTDPVPGSVGSPVGHRCASADRLYFLLALCAGCLEVPAGPGQECVNSSDCNQAAGEVCEEGICWGNPPVGTYAATLSPPAVREADLVATEIPLLDLPRDGWLGDIVLAAPVTISGRVEMACPTGQPNCPTTSVAAEVRITRPSRFPGGPAVRLSAQSKAGMARGQDSFSIRIPRTQPGDPPYKVTIDPEGGASVPPAHGGKDPAELVPPRRFELHATDDLEHQTYLLGSPSPQVISGVIKDALGGFLTDYRVVALGRWDQQSSPTEVSSVCFTTDGYYSLTLSENTVGPIELVARPYNEATVAPELHITDVGAYGPQTRNITQPTGLGARVDLTIKVEGLDSDGGVKPVSGARVLIVGSTENSVTAGIRATIASDAVTNEAGNAQLSVLDGAALASTYRMHVIPPAGSSLGIVYGSPVVLSAIPTVRLPKRVAISGTVVDVHGEPLGDVAVTARRALRFLWSLEAAEQTFLNEIPAASDITPETGEFVVWVDPEVASTWGHYDLFFETANGSSAPNWSIPDFEIPRVPDQESIELDKVGIPDAAYLHGKIVDGGGGIVEGSLLRVFQLSANDNVCREVINAPEECEGDAKVLGHGESDENGLVRFTLPRP